MVTGASKMSKTSSADENLFGKIFIGNEIQ